MPLQSAIVKAGATGFTVTAGADETFTPNGTTVVNGLQIADAAQTDFRIRKSMTVKNRNPTLDSLGVYSKDKKSVTFTAPKILASGKVVFDLIRIEREVHPEATAAEALELNYVGAQILFGAHFANFWSAGSLA